MIISINKTLKIRSPAKINLALQILGKNGNYHNLNSIAVFGVAYDDIIINEAVKDEVLFNESERIENNTVIKALEYIRSKGIKLPQLHINIVKNIPIGSGLGGGSANAASLLAYITKITGKQFDLDELTKIGADVPVSYIGKPQIFNGNGSIIREIEIPKLHILLVNPGIHNSTIEMFAKVDSYSVNVDFSNIYLNVNSFVKDLKLAGNDFIRFCDLEIQNLITEISQEEGCLYASMSGSGSTCFGIFNNLDSLEFSYLKFKKTYSYYWIMKGTI